MINRKTQKMNKKGSMSALVTIIIFCVIAFSLLALTGKLVLFGKDTAGTQTCRKCLELGNSNNIIDVNCECFGEELLIKYKDVVEGGVINQNKAHKIIANAMYDTLYKYHGGTLDPAPDFKDIKEEGICRAGYYIKFDSKLRKWMVKNLGGKLSEIETDFENKPPAEKAKAKAEAYKKYGITNPLPFLLREAKSRGGGMSYYEYLTKESNPESAAYFGTETLLNTGTLMEYSTIQLRYIRDDDGPSLGEILGAFTLSGGNVISLIINSFIIHSIFDSLEKKSEADEFSNIQGLETYLIAFPDKNAFKNCKNCVNAGGGVILLPPNFDYGAKWSAQMGDSIESWPVCSVLLG